MNEKPDIPHYIFMSCAIVTAMITILALVFLVYTAFPILQKEGLNFIFGKVWSL